MSNEIPCTRTSDLVHEFASRGLVLLSPDDLGIPAETHAKVYENEKRAYHNKERVTPSSIPDVLDVLTSPGLTAACDQLVGKNWAIVPFTHNASFTSGPRDQHWHKDDNGPYNGRKQRHHQSVQLEMLYYPQEVREDMGPTATIPYSQYWTYNHEENHDNFAGADHLDFVYQLSGMERQHVSGPESEYSRDDIINQRTAHDIRMRDAVTDTGWPLVKQFEAAPLRAGSVLLYSHNTFHRGNHRRDDHSTWRDNPRFMWRFWIYRTTDGDLEESDSDPVWTGIDPLTQVDLTEVSDDLTTVWRYHEHWIRTGDAPNARPAAATAPESDRRQEAEKLAQQLREKGDEAEPIRTGAAYKLASIGDDTLATEILGEALYDDRESVRRAATYGLIAVGDNATPTLIEAAASPSKWVRKAGVYGLGDVSPLSKEPLAIIKQRLLEDPSVYVRSVAAGTLGCMGRRSIARGQGVDLLPAAIDALLASLSQEGNRVAMDLAQGRSIKFVRPTDDSDVCEGGGIDFGLDRFKRVRSAVRENALWSLVILSSHGTENLGPAMDSTVSTMHDIVRTDENVINVGFALDVLTRLAHVGTDTAEAAKLRDQMVEILGDSPVRAWEALVRSGLSREKLGEM